MHRGRFCVVRFKALGSRLNPGFYSCTSPWARTNPWEPPSPPHHPGKGAGLGQGQGKPLSKPEIANGLGTKHIGNTPKKL